jgi:hypothetical protein
MKALIAKNPLNSVLSILTPATVPTLFVCPLKHRSDAPLVEKHFQGLPDVSNVTTGAP